jgi:hypothetical protein
MEYEIVNLSESNLDDIPGTCSQCVYWSFPEVFNGSELLESKQELKNLKKQWSVRILKEFGNCCKILYYNGIPVGYAEYGPSNYFPKIMSYISQNIGIIEDGVIFLSCLYISDDKLWRKKLGTKLLLSIIEDLKKRGYKSIETFARKDSSDNPSGPVDFYLKNGFKIKNEVDSTFSIVRLNL